MSTSRSEQHVLIICSRNDKARGEFIRQALSTIGLTAAAVEGQKEVPKCVDGTVMIVDCIDDRSSAERLCDGLRTELASHPILAIVQPLPSHVRAGLFEAGVDQILTCPFSLRELWACIFALTRRFAGLSRERSTDETGKPSSDRHNQPPAVMDALDLLSAARCIGLTETERRIWAHLAGRDQPVTAAELLDSVFCSNRHDADSTLVRVHIHRLRKKLKGIGLNIEGLHGYGYRITSATARVDARRLGERR